MKIALCGKMRSGKDTVADFLRSNHGIESFAFSEGIWETIRLLYPKVYERRHFEKPRRLLQELGQKLRMVDPNIWVNYTLERIEYVGAENVVITDLRQPNEYEELRRQGYVIVKVQCSVEKRLERAKAAGDNFTMQDLLHETERHIDRFKADFVIENEGTIDHVEKQVEMMVNMIQQNEPKGGTMGAKINGEISERTAT